MNKLYLIIGLLFLSVLGTTTTLKAQKTVSQAEYEAIIDYINCQFAELSLKDQPNQPHYAAFQAEVANNCNEPRLISFLRTRKPSPLKNNLELIASINLYKDNYVADNRKLYETLANKLFKEELVVNFGSKSKRSTTFPLLKANLKSYLKEKLPYDANEVPVTEYDENFSNSREDARITLEDPPDTTENTAETTTTATTDDNEITTNIADNIEESTERTPNGSGSSWMRVGLILILLIIMAYLFLKYYETNFKTGQSPTKPANGMSRNKKIAALQYEVQTLKDKNQALEQEIVRLKGIISELEGQATQNRNIKIKPKDELTAVKDPVVTPPLPTAVKEVFYMPIPSSDGSFHNSLRTNSFESTESVYRFEVIGDGQAEFKLVSDSRTMQRAINGFDNYIRPVCQSSNAFSLSATQVVTDKPGIVEKDGGVWKLRQRAIIHYE